MTSRLFWHTKLAVLIIASSSNGRTADSDSVNLGSNPGEAANKKSPTWGFFIGYLPKLKNQVVRSSACEFCKPRWRGGASHPRSRALARDAQCESRAPSKVKHIFIFPHMGDFYWLFTWVEEPKYKIIPKYIFCLFNIDFPFEICYLIYKMCYTNGENLWVGLKAKC